MSDRQLSHAFLDGPAPQSIPVDSPPRPVGRGAYAFEVMAAPGNYEFYAATKTCGGQVMAVGYAGYTRSLSILLSQFGGVSGNALFDHDHVSLTGSVDAPGATLELVDADNEKRKRFLIRDRAAFFADSLQRTRWYLDVHLGCCRMARFPIDLSTAFPGDYATVHLTARDVAERLSFHGSMFSDPADLSLDGTEVWYANAGRKTIGRIGADQSRREFSAGDATPRRIAADGEGGAWFITLRDAVLYHIDGSGRVAPSRLDSPDDEQVLHGLYVANGVAYASAAGNTRIYRADLRGAVAHIETRRADPKLGFDPNGRAWVMDGPVFTAFDAAGAHSQPVEAALAGGVRQWLGTFFEVPSRFARSGLDGSEIPKDQATAIASWLPESGIADFDSGFSVARSSDGANWLADCDNGALVRLGGPSDRQRFSTGYCPHEIVADRSGGVWYASRSEVVHLDPDGVQRRFPMPSTNALPTSLRVDPTDTLWFVERQANKIAYVRRGRVNEIDLGNPGATPTFTLVP